MTASKEKTKLIIRKKFRHCPSCAISLFKGIYGNTQGFGYLKLAQTTWRNIVRTMQILWGKSSMLSSFSIFLVFSGKVGKEEYLLEP